MCSSSFTWQLWVDFLSHVLWQVTRHLPPDVHKHSGLRGGDLVDEHWAGIGQHQLSVVGLKLRAVLQRRTVDSGGVQWADLFNCRH